MMVLLEEEYYFVILLTNLLHYYLQYCCYLYFAVLADEDRGAGGGGLLVLDVCAIGLFVGLFDGDLVFGFSSTPPLVEHFVMVLLQACTLLSNNCAFGQGMTLLTNSYSLPPPIKYPLLQ